MSVSRKIRFDFLQREVGNPCAVCGEREGPFEVDHVKPESDGGPDDFSNLRKLCRRCNGGKSNLVEDAETGALVRPVVHKRTPEEVGEGLRTLRVKILQALLKAPPISFRREYRYGRGEFDVAQGGATKEELAVDHGISKTGLDEALNLLRDAGIIARCGSVRGRWYLVFDILNSPHADEEAREIAASKLQEYIRDLDPDFDDPDMRMWGEMRYFPGNIFYLYSIKTGKAHANPSLVGWYPHPLAPGYEWCPASNAVRVVNPFKTGDIWVDPKGVRHRCCWRSKNEASFEQAAGAGWYGSKHYGNPWELLKTGWKPEVVDEKPDSIVLSDNLP